MLYQVQKVIGEAVGGLAGRKTLGQAFVGAASLGLGGVVDGMMDSAVSRASCQAFDKAQEAALKSPGAKAAFEREHMRNSFGPRLAWEPLEQIVGRKKMEEAALRGEVETVKSLLAEGINPNNPEFDFSSALHNALHHGQIECIKVLRDSGALVFGPRTEELMISPGLWVLRPEVGPFMKENTSELIALKQEIIASLPDKVREQYFPPKNNEVSGPAL